MLSVQLEPNSSARVFGVTSKQPKRLASMSLLKVLPQKDIFKERSWFIPLIRIDKGAQNWRLWILV
jgi:hypothetical protein